MRRSPSARRAAATTSCEVTPAGLSTSSRPPAEDSARRPRIGVAGLLLDLREQRLDARRAGDALVQLEDDVGGEPQAQGAADGAAELRGDGLQAVEGRLPVL